MQSSILKNDLQLDIGLPFPQQVVSGNSPSLYTGRYQQNKTIEKTLGAVYTPPRVAAALTRWAVRSPADRILDPSCGEGVFLSSARTRLADLGARKVCCVGVDVDPKAAQASGAVCKDFFEWFGDAPKFDVIIGNPPFVRSHLFPEKSRTAAFAEMIKLGIKPSRLMSTWSPFLALCSHLLTDNGRLALVIPEELLHVGYAEDLRQLLLKKFRRVIVCLPVLGIFPKVQQAVIMLLCDNDIEGPAGLLSLDYLDLEAGNYEATKSAPPWLWNAKWTHLFLAPNERQLLNDCWPRLGWHPLCDYGRVEVGVVTGDNNFFILNQKRAAEFDQKHLTPILTGSKDLRGIRFGAEDFKQLAAEQRPLFLLKIHEPIEQLPRSIRIYLESGQRQHVSERYKCRVREPWYAVPSIKECDAVLLRQAGEMPRLIHLTKRCTSTDTMHRVNWHRHSLGRRHTVSFLNTWTLLASELTGRSYGGGVLELMPSEANQLPLPEPTEKLEEIFEAVDEKVRSKQLYEALSIVDSVVKPRWMNKNQCEHAENILLKLIQRRNSRSYVND